MPLITLVMVSGTIIEDEIAEELVVNAAALFELRATGGLVAIKGADINDASRLVDNGASASGESAERILFAMTGTLTVGTDELNAGADELIARTDELVGE